MFVVSATLSTLAVATRVPEISSFSHDFGLRGSAVFKHLTLQMFVKRAKKRSGTAENFCRRMSLQQRPPRLR